MPLPVDAVRRFTRFYTRRIGVLDRHLLQSSFSLSEGRVLYELAHGDGTTARDLGEALGIDAGYLSRMLAGFSRRGLIARGRSGTDARARPISLTPRGRAAFAPLDRRSHEQVTAILRPLSIAERRRLAAAMQSIEQILDPADFPRTRRAASSGTPFTLRALEPGDIGWITHRQELLYFEEYGWNEEFEALIARIMAEYVERHDTKMENCWIAEHGGRTAGAVFVMKRSATVAQLRLLYVEPGARGLGIGRRLVDECIRFARARRYRRMILWTNSVLVSARRIYEAAGFTLTKSERHHSFGKDLVGQYWTKQL